MRFGDERQAAIRIGFLEEYLPALVEEPHWSRAASDDLVRGIVAGEPSAGRFVVEVFGLEEMRCLFVESSAVFLGEVVPQYEEEIGRNLSAAWSGASRTWRGA